mmetsp:Transcript_104952/g.182425  ORF Transcript_104952/g.182425 Transcript_104952/m.182425 type:complete len:193 (-) Transcript_104952:6-584(-)
MESYKNLLDSEIQISDEKQQRRRFTAVTKGITLALMVVLGGMCLWSLSEPSMSEKPIEVVEDSVLPMGACYAGSASAFWQTEYLYVKFLNYSDNSSSGHIYLKGAGVSDFECPGMKFENNDLMLSVDINECGLSGCSIDGIKYDPKRDEIITTIAVDLPPITKDVKMRREKCASSEKALSTNVDSKKIIITA